MKQIINITSNSIKQAIDDLVNDNELLQDKVYKQEEEEINRLNNIINYIWQVFENGSFEDGCDCIKIYDYLKELKVDDNQ